MLILVIRQCYYGEMSNDLFPKAEAVAQRCSVKKVFLEISQIQRKTPVPEFLFYKVAGLRPATLLQKETLAQMFSCELWEISKNTFFHRTPQVAALGAASFMKLCCITLG